MPLLVEIARNPLEVCGNALKRIHDGRSHVAEAQEARDLAGLQLLEQPLWHARRALRTRSVCDREQEGRHDDGPQRSLKLAMRSGASGRARRLGFVSRATLPGVDSRFETIRNCSRRQRSVKVPAEHMPGRK